VVPESWHRLSRRISWPRRLRRRHAEAIQGTEYAVGAEGLDFGELWPAFRDVFGEDDDPPPDAAEQLAGGFEEFRGYVSQWFGPLVASTERGAGLVVA
jgi:hypothetical protein